MPCSALRSARSVLPNGGRDLRLSRVSTPCSWSAYCAVTISQRPTLRRAPPPTSNQESALGALPVAMSRFLPALTTRTEVEGKVVLASNSKRQNWWAMRGALSFPHLAKVAVKLLSFHVTSCATERNWSLWGNIFVKGRNRLALQRAEKLVMIRGNAKNIEHHRSEEKVVLSLLAEK
eukprot:TRINITY_DN4297_c0_g2_i1.p1 TRINITY_DN4297_c0_g2~~TRINITY_DN4297_c0_g2_i1.p1  ORF type:complete len:177 (-),score=10.78 TRINITY_DN4297_c0_g2_i1:76-606(-)